MRLHPFYDESGEIGANSVEGSEVAAGQTTEPEVVTEGTQQESTEDVTKTESFAKRLKESVAAERQKWEREDAVRIKQEARDAYFAEQGYTYNGKEIKTESEYNQALKDQEAFENLKQQSLPDEVIQELIENRNFRQTKQQQEQQQKEFQAFYEAYPDAKAENIPVSVWEDVARGKSLVDAYARHENQTLKQKLAELEKGKEIEQLNQENATVSTGSVVGQGTAIVTNFTREQVAAMSKEEMERNYPAVIASMKTWKK